jgi:Protein of unknown function (DUF1587)/Planctomycete cytochrome C
MLSALAAPSRDSRLCRCCGTRHDENEIDFWWSMELENWSFAVMRNTCLLFIASCWSMSSIAFAQTFKADVAPLIEESCIDCHDADTKTRLNLESLGHDLANPDTFRRWVKIFDRARSGEMPPKREPRPDAALLQTALASLERDLRATNLDEQRTHGRVPSRRLTRLEYEYTVRDLLSIHDDLAGLLPEEADTGGFDTVGGQPEDLSDPHSKLSASRGSGARYRFRESMKASEMLT